MIVAKPMVVVFRLEEGLIVDQHDFMLLEQDLLGP